MQGADFFADSDAVSAACRAVGLRLEAVGLRLKEQHPTAVPEEHTSYWTGPLAEKVRSSYDNWQSVLPISCVHTLGLL